MRWRFSARTLITLASVAIAAGLVLLLIATVRQSLADAYASAIPDTIAALSTVGVVLITLAGLATWVLTGYLLAPVNAMRRDLKLAARSRALAESVPGEQEELGSLRLTLASVLSDLEAQNASAMFELRRVLGLFEGISEGIVQVGPSGRFVHVNAAGRRLLRLPHHPEGHTPASLIRNLELREMIECAARGEQVAPAEVSIDSRQLLVAPQILPAVNGENGGAVVTVVDLTELRRLESVRRDFVANVSHELKTPLTSIRGYTETLLTDDLPRALQVHFLEVIEKNATRIQRIVEDLLDLSRLQSGGWQPNLQEVEITALAQDAWTSCESAAARKGITFDVVGGPAFVLADLSGLRQVFSNLFENAVRYTPEGGAIKILLHRSARNADLTEVEVRDSGVGIPGESLPRIFERFYRVNPARSRADGGTGLGLSIVKHLIEQMGGDVMAESELGKGTAVKLRLPAAENDG